MFVPFEASHMYVVKRLFSNKWFNAFYSANIFCRAFLYQRFIFFSVRPEDA